MILTVPLQPGTLLDNVRYRWIAAGVEGSPLSTGITQPDLAFPIFRFDVTPPDNAEEIIVYDLTEPANWNPGNYLEALVKSKLDVVVLLGGSNLIIGNLAELKAAVLPVNLRDRADWDNAIGSLGRGIAMAMQKFCNRLFERIEDDTYERNADCSYLSLPRFPVESVSLIELKVDEVGGFVAQPNDTILSLNKASGIVEFGSKMGWSTARIRATYTGGFWANYSGTDTIPVGATPMPDDLVHAWQLQAQHEIEATNLLRGVAAKRPQDKPETAAGEAKLITRVQEMLKPFVRYS